MVNVVTNRSLGSAALLFFPVFLPHTSPVSLQLALVCVAPAVYLLVKLAKSPVPPIAFSALSYLAAAFAVVSIPLVVIVTLRGNLLDFIFLRYAGFFLAFFLYSAAWCVLLSGPSHFEDRVRAVWLIFIGIMLLMTLQELVVARIFGQYFLSDLWKSRQNIGDLDTLHYLRVSGSFDYPGDFAVAAGVAILSCLFLQFFRGTRSQRCAGFIFFLLLIFGLLLSESRAGLVYLLVASSTILALRFRRDLFIWSILVGGMYFSGWSVTNLGSWGFTYLAQGYEDPSSFIDTSRRFQEWAQIIDQGWSVVLFGVSNGQVFDFYESELVGLIARTGFTGFVFLFMLSLPAFLLLRNRNSLFCVTSVIWLSYLFVYCAASAGLSRPKTMVVATLVFSTTLIGLIVARQRKRVGVFRLRTRPRAETTLC